MPILPKPNDRRASRQLTVLNPLGIHARPAAEFVRKVQSFRSQVWIELKEKRFDAGRLMELLMANLDHGTTFLLTAEGCDADQVVDSIEKLLTELRDAEARGEFS